MTDGSIFPIEIMDGVHMLIVEVESLLNDMKSSRCLALKFEIHLFLSFLVFEI